MAKNQQSNRKSLCFITISISCFIILITITIFDYKILNNLLAKNRELNDTLSKATIEHTTELNKEKILINEISELENLDDTISKTKNAVFTSAKELENKILNNETNYKIAYLTFDDGPYHLTDKVLDILKQYNVKATFFTIGLNKDTCFDDKSYSCYDTYQKIVENGHTIANHTYSHLIFNDLYKSHDSFIEQVKKQETLIKDRTGVTTNILRFPGGSSTAKSLCKNDINKIMETLKESNYGWVDWTAQDGDGGYLPTYEKAWSNFVGSINEDIEVVLFHDYSQITVSLLPNAIEYLESNDYIILPLFYDSVKVNK